MFATASQPQRATTSFTITWGLMAISVSAFTGTEETSVTRKEFLQDGKTLVPVGRSPIRKDTGEVIDSADVVRMAEASTGEFVILTDEEIADCTAPKGIGEVVCFVPVKDVSNYSAVTQYQVRPKATKGKADPAAAKAYALLRTVLKTSKVVALIKVALRGPARYALLDHEGTLTFVRTADQVREPRDLDEFKFTAQELALAKVLVEAVGIDTPVITDDTAPVVQAYVEAKATGKVIAPATPAIPAGGDIMAQIEASLAAIKKGKVAS
jgi:DNA end-binding protein Ku